MFSRLNYGLDPNKRTGSPGDGCARMPVSPVSHGVTYLGYVSALYHATAEREG